VVSKDLGGLLESGSTFGLLAPALSLPIFDGGRLRAGLAKSDADYDLAVAAYNQSVVQALRDVADQVNATRSLADQVQAQQQAQANAQVAHALAQQRYRAGIGSYLEVLSTQDQLLQVEQRLSIPFADFRRSEIVRHVIKVRDLKRLGRVRLRSLAPGKGLICL